MSNKKIQKAIVYVMIGSMVALSVLSGLGALLM